jgi:hypothetical protein
MTIANGAGEAPIDGVFVTTLSSVCGNDFSGELFGDGWGRSKRQDGDDSGPSEHLLDYTLANPDISPIPVRKADQKNDP